jgi:NAD(P)-dependent dehydrogenase (short-subunit alcohol dehydrogenase family)
MSAAEVQDMKDASSGRVSLTVCDMTKEDSVKAWAGGVSNELGDAGLNLLINNTGILTPGPIEVLPLDAIRREFDVKMFGALSVMNAYLPALRKARGRIVQISTWTASVPLPFNGIDFDTPSPRGAGETPLASVTSRNAHTSPRSKGVPPSATLRRIIEGLHSVHGNANFVCQWKRVDQVSAIPRRSSARRFDRPSNGRPKN